VWPWLLGHYIDARLRVYGDKAQARALLGAFARHLQDAGIGTVSEIFDAEPPFDARGCIAQAWSVAEVLRAYVEDVKAIRPAPQVENKAPQAPAKIKDRSVTSAAPTTREVSRVGTRG